MLIPVVSISYVPGALLSEVFFGAGFINAKFLRLVLIMIGVVFVGLRKQ